MDKLTIINSLLRDYSIKRENKIVKANENLKNALNDNIFKELYFKDRTIDFDIAKLESENKNVDLLKKEQNTIKTLIKKRLIELKINYKTFQPQFDCNVCNDTGRINGQYCKCFKMQYYNKLVQQSGLSSKNIHSFIDFNENLFEDKKQLEQAFKLKNIFIKYAEKYPDVKLKNILISGCTGVGKTFLLECLASELIKKGKTVTFTTAFEMNNLFVSYHTSFETDKQNYLDTLLEPDILFIDDLGSEPIKKNITIEYLYTIISERMLKDKATIISTNLGQDNILTRYGERIFSRLNYKTNTMVVHLTGKDLRFE